MVFRERLQLNTTKTKILWFKVYMVSENKEVNKCHSLGQTMHNYPPYVMELATFSKPNLFNCSQGDWIIDDFDFEFEYCVFMFD